MKAQELIRRIESRKLYVCVSSAAVPHVVARKLLNERDLLSELSAISLDQMKTPLDPGDIRFFVSRVNFGMGCNYPIEYVLSYDHKDPKKPPGSIPHHQYPPDLPRQYDVWTIFVYVTRKEVALMDSAAAAFDAWHRQNSVDDQGTPFPSTPHKRTHLIPTDEASDPRPKTSRKEIPEEGPDTVPRRLSVGNLENKINLAISHTN